MDLINGLIIFELIALVAIVLVNTRTKGIIVVSAVVILSLLSSYISLKSLIGNAYEIRFLGTAIFGDVPLKIDALSAWFILVINFTFITGALYGFNYMKQYREQKKEITLHCLSFVIAHFALIGICAVQNGFVFLLLWEMMAISVFLLVIFEHQKPETIKAGINYIVQSHISIVFIMLGFIYVAIKTGSYDFDAITDFSSQQSRLSGIALFLCFFIGFAIKAGFVPFHTWLPYAHPAAPSHVSGIMSGVVIKIGIYGILRMLLLIKTDYSTIGYIILLVSIVTGIYGVMLAIIQHNLKKLLAYHSVENIGIIGIGIGLGCIGLGETNKWMAILGFSGALLHTLNHSLFKSLLFYSAGNVYQSTHTMDIEHLGGLIKRMPKTAIFFLLASIAICGLPPLNGFISEFLILGGIYNWLYSAELVSLVAVAAAIIGLVLIGGLAILCFTKAFSIVFLGNAREVKTEEVYERSKWQLLPMYLTCTLMVSIGIFPSFFIGVLQKPLNLFTQNMVFNLNLLKVGAIDSLQIINWLFIGFILLVVVFLRFKNYINRKRKIETGSTWGCGYEPVSPRIQYTASSYAKSYSKLARPLLEINKHEDEIKEIFPLEKHYETHPYDKIEKIFIDKPISHLGKISDLFLFLQNGNLQSYILYGIIFVTSVICIPLILEKILLLINFLNHL
jgi:hydrogenase-4 component B